MKTQAIRIYENGGPEVLEFEDVEVLAPKAGEAMIRQHAVGLNFVDTYFRSGLYPSKFPTGLGNEGAGVVEAIGEDVTHIQVGDRVAYGQSPIGAYAVSRTMPAWQLVKIPPEISFNEAAGMMLKGLTVQYLFRQTYKLKENETILFHAAAGGVGSIACQWAKALGVNLIGTVGSDEKAQLAKANGAWKTINYLKENVVEKVNEFTNGKKVPVVYDGVGKDTWESSLDCLQQRGLMISYGNASGAVTGVNLGLLAQKGSLYVTRPMLGSYVDTPERMQAAAKELIDLVVEKKIKIEVSQTYALKDVGIAHQELTARKTTGATILIP